MSCHFWLNKKGTGGETPTCVFTLAGARRQVRSCPPGFAWRHGTGGRHGTGEGHGTGVGHGTGGRKTANLKNMHFSIIVLATANRNYVIK